MIQETIYALEVLPPPFLKYFYLFIILFAHMLIFSRGSIVLLSFLVFCQISKNVPFIFCYVFLIVFLHLIIHSSIGKICIFEISFSLISILKKAFHSLWNEGLLIHIALISRYRKFSSSKQNWIKH